MAMEKINEKRKMIVSKLVTKMPKRDWRMQSTGMALHHEVDRFARKTKDNFITLVITIIGMATALTWNEVVRTVIQTVFPDRAALYAQIYVAIIVTIFTLVATYAISRVRDNGHN